MAEHHDLELPLAATPTSSATNQHNSRYSTLTAPAQRGPADQVAKAADLSFFTPQADRGRPRSRAS